MNRLLSPALQCFDSDKSKDKKFIVGVLVGSYIAYRVIRKCIHLKNKCDTNKKIKDKQEECKQFKKIKEEFLIKEKGMTREKMEKIVMLPIQSLMEELQTGKLKAVDVLNAYQMKALEVDKLTNSVTEVISEAEELALSRDLDNRKKGPLFGIPISVKECLMIKGYDCTGGMACCLNKPAPTDNVLIQVLKEQGAIPFVITNLPQTMMTYECANPIFGVTNNPHDPKRIPGGSSGGEGALIGGGGSILGIGSDIGGSVRIPAHMSGCCAFKPTYGRLSCKGVHDFQGGQKLVCATPGPMAADVDGLVACMKSLLVPRMFELDPTIPPVPFRNEIFKDKRKLTIGFYVDDGHLQPVPACQRAVLEVKAILEAQGHTVVPFKPVDIYRMTELIAQVFFADAGKSYLDVLATDKVDPTIAGTMIALTWPKWFKKLAAYVLGKLTKDKMMSIYGQAMAGVGSIDEYWELAMQIEAYKSDFLKKWNDNKLDALICPGFAYPAIPHGTVQYCTAGVTYTTLYNLLNYPAGMLKVTKVTEQDVVNLKTYPSNTWTEKYVKQFSQDTVGLPVGVQFVSLPFQEEQVLRLMKEVESSLIQ